MPNNKFPNQVARCFHPLNNGLIHIINEITKRYCCSNKHSKAPGDAKARGNRNEFAIKILEQKKDPKKHAKKKIE